MTTPDRPADRLAAFDRCQSAEEYFALLDVAYDPRVVSVNRLHILRHFAGQLERIRQSPAAAEPAALDAYRDALTRSYQAFTTATALDHRLFRVLRDRAPRDRAPRDRAPWVFVPLAAVTARPGSQR